MDTFFSCGVVLLLAACAGPETQDVGQQDVDGDGIFSQHDCDDTNADLGATTLWYLDEDGDGYGQIYDAIQACESPGSDYSVASGDCNDTDPTVSPGALEACNGVDDDCDGEVDEGNAGSEGTAWYVDSDGDGYGGPVVAGIDCEPGNGWVGNSSDCDDADAALHPGADERCSDGIDNNCDGLVDDPSSIDATQWYVDADEDTFGDPATTAWSCGVLQGHVTRAEDCDDTRHSVNPIAQEVCDGLDNNCDGTTDDDDPWRVGAPAWYEDADSDGFGSGVVRMISCAGAPGFAPNDQDCADSDAEIHPDATEVCDGIDNDCDGRLDTFDLDLDLTTAPRWYPDSDGDGFGSGGPVVRACQQPVKHSPLGTDCNDGHADSWPGAAELCDGLDNDCDSLIDEDTPTQWYPDLDQDGFGDPTADPVSQCEPVEDHAKEAGDCNDGNAAIHPQAEEICDGVDNDCDSLVDDDDDTVVATGSVWYADRDGDHHGSAHEPREACEQPAGFVASADDCDDTREQVYPLAPELCDDIDNDCDGHFDDADSDLIGAPLAYLDGDRDGFGSPFSETERCVLPVGYVRQADDCNDSASSIHPGATEVCNGEDDNCNGRVDDDDPDVDPNTFVEIFEDQDEDGFGSQPLPSACLRGAGTASRDGDCDDSDPTSHPGAVERCDGSDNNCNGLIDDGTPSLWSRDSDGDGHGDPTVTQAGCYPPEGYVGPSDDCDDTTADVHPGAPELCNGRDDDCDQAVDDDDTDVEGLAWYFDADADGYGTDASSVHACLPPSGYVAAAGDCQDSHAQIHPGAVELCGGVDEDCDGLTDDDDPSRQGGTAWHPDADGDGFGANASVSACLRPQHHVEDATDCDDSNYKVNPDATEVCTPGDDDCNGLADDADPGVTGKLAWFADQDGDGFGDPSSQSTACIGPEPSVQDHTDCDDDDAGRNPAATEVPGNSIDEDCNGSILCFADLDGDGFGGVQTTTDGGDGSCGTQPGEAANNTDCDDATPTIHPDAAETCDPGDQNCNGLLEDEDPALAGDPTYFPDQDGDGYGDANGVGTVCIASGRVDNATDCDDAVATTHPDALEVPGNAVDEDCSGTVDCYQDLDGDGFGSPVVVVDDGDGSCLTSQGESTNGDDCADSAPQIHPLAEEQCGGGDSNCNGLTDDDDPFVVGPLDAYADADGDGSGDPAQLLSSGSCALPPGAASNPYDCDDNDAAVFHGSPCDDGDSCSKTSLCQAGECAGASDADEDCACTDSCATVGEDGCCEGQCSGPACSDCPAGASCKQNCESENTCASITCAPGSVCSYVSRNFWQGPSDLQCNGATCDIACLQFSGVCGMTCTDTAACELSCNQGDACELTCEDDSACMLDCSQDMNDCTLTCEAPQTCSDGTQVCGRPCPQ